jgi:hypothetical protein
VVETIPSWRESVLVGIGVLGVVVREKREGCSVVVVPIVEAPSVGCGILGGCHGVVLSVSCFDMRDREDLSCKRGLYWAGGRH